MTTVKPSRKLTLHDKLSRLDFLAACKLLGPQGKKLILQGAKREIEVAEDVFLGGDLLRVNLRGAVGVVEAITTLTLKADARDRLHWHCDRCDNPCEHVGAMFSLVLEEKVLLGLAAPPPERDAATPRSDEELVERALAERRERARAEKMKISSSDDSTPWADYSVTSLVSGKSYRVALRGLERGQSYCTCPDFKTNTLGTCKHVMKAAAFARRKFTDKQLARAHRPRRLAVHLAYGETTTLRLAVPDNLPPEVASLVRPFAGEPIEDVPALLKCLGKLDARGRDYVIFPDAEEYIQEKLHAERISAKMAEIRRDPARHALRETLLKTPLLPYQLDGIAFAVGAGRAVLADDMGLGKTIQAVGVAELLAREAEIKRVLVICPASLKSQWRNEIQRFCGRSVQLISGRLAERATQYNNSSFFTICNYEQVLRDILEIERVPWDLIVLDEGQRIKNWEARTTRVIKGLKSRFALVLSGTPLENRLDELYSVVQFIDDRRLGPGFRFFHEHRLLDGEGKVLGYKNLDRLRQRLRPILLRRTRDSVRLELPERTSEIVRIPPTDEQQAMHHAHLQNVGMIVSKPYLTEMDMLRLRMELLMCRLSANGTYLVNKQQPNHSSKLERLAEIFDDLADETSRKVVLFSEWTTMLDLIEPLLKKCNLQFVRLDGSVPQKKRQELVHAFQTNPECRFFITTNAGSTGLNLQAANTVINVDLPWNPAVLEQRIGRAHRMGQKRPVQVYILITEGTLEENLLVTLSNKKDLALAALDAESEVDTVEMKSGTEDLKARLEILLGAKPEALLDETQKEAAQAQIAAVQRERVAAAGGELLGAAFQFLGELVASAQPTAAASPAPEVVETMRTRLASCAEPDEAGRPRLTLTLPNREALDNLAQTLARLLATAEPG